MKFTYFQNHVVTITYDDELQLGTAVWNGFLTSQELREATEACLKLMEEHKPLRWLGDNRKLRVLRQADQDWFIQHAYPRLLASTLRRNATVVSEDLFNRMAMEQLMKRASSLGDMIMKEFDSVAAAMQWLKEPITVQEVE